MSGNGQKQYGVGAQISDLPDDTKPAPRGGPAAAATRPYAGAAAVMEPPVAPEKKAPGDFERRGGSGGFVPTEGAKGSDLVGSIDAPAERKTRKFWLGTLPTCPRAVVHVGGQEFPDYCDPEVKILGGQRRRAFQLGVLVDLTDAQIARIKEGLARRFIRWSGNGQGDLYCIPTPRDLEEMKKRQRSPVYPASGDDWLARHIYMVEASHRGDVYPPSAYETGIRVAGPAAA